MYNIYVLYTAQIYNIKTTGAVSTVSYILCNLIDEKKKIIKGDIDRFSIFKVVCGSIIK